MAIIEQIPIADESAESKGGKESLAHGKFALTESEKAEIRRRAEAAGEDPEEAVRTEEERMEAATARLREKQAEEAVEQLKKSIH